MITQNESSLIQVSTYGDQLVVDSRLIAAQLGIEHPSLLRTIEKYLDRLQRYSPVRFEIDVVKRPQGGTFNLRYAWLDEKQATLLMTYSRNTEQVLDCKDALVDAFEKAKRIIPLQSDRIQELELELQLATALTQKAIAEKAVIDTRNTIVKTCPEIIQQKILGYQVIEKPEYIDRTITPDGEVCDGVGITYIQKRYGFKSTKEAWGWLERIGMGKFSKIWKSERKLVEASVLPRDCLKELDSLFDNSSRQLYLGE